MTAALPQAADARYRPVRYPVGPPLSAASLRWVRRLTYGYSPALAQQVRRAGGTGRWFEQQLRPGRIADTEAGRLRAWWPSLDRSPAELWRRQTDDVEGGWEVMLDYQAWVLLRRTTSNRQLLEQMTELWETLLHVPASGDSPFVWRVSYGDAIRARALRSYREVLYAAITHPAMQLHLDNAGSSAKAPNENLGRELLELFTVGRGAFTEDDVKASARILTGFHVDRWNTWAASYRPENHAVGAVRVLGFRHANGAADGRPVVRAYLDYLARHPSTARRIARRIAVRFVGDAPPNALVEHLAKVYLKADTDIPTVLRALVARREFRTGGRTKLRDPSADVVATLRALGAKVGRPAPEGSSPRALVWISDALGGGPLNWPRPDGPPQTAAGWASPSRALASFDFHWGVAGGWYPSRQVVYRTPTAWLPRSSLSFGALVDFLSIRMLGERSTPLLLRACCEATNYRRDERITRDHPLVKWEFHRLLATILDSPSHLMR